MFRVLAPFGSRRNDPSDSSAAAFSKYVEASVYMRAVQFAEVNG